MLIIQTMIMCLNILQFCKDSRPSWQKGNVWPSYKKVQKACEYQNFHPFLLVLSDKAIDKADIAFLEVEEEGVAAS